MTNTAEDFENAPIGATATHKTMGSRAVKTGDAGRSWVTPSGSHLGDKEMVYWGFTIDPLAPTTEREALDAPAPTTAREALDLAWTLAHEVKPGQVIPAGTRFLEFSNSRLKEYVAQANIEISPDFASVRTLEPLPDPEPSWIDAPAVIATCGYCETKALHGPLEDRSCWECAECQIATTWRALTDVTPLYPRGTEV